MLFVCVVLIRKSAVRNHVILGCLAVASATVQRTMTHHPDQAVPGAGTCSARVPRIMASPTSGCWPRRRTSSKAGVEEIVVAPVTSQGACYRRLSLELVLLCIWNHTPLYCCIPGERRIGRQRSEWLPTRGQSLRPEGHILCCSNPA